MNLASSPITSLIKNIRIINLVVIVIDKSRGGRFAEIISETLKARFFYLK